MKTSIKFFIFLLVATSFTIITCSKQFDSVDSTLSDVIEDQNQDGIFREITAEPEVCRFWCSGECNPCTMQGTWESSFNCNTCSGCLMYFEYDDEIYAVGDPGYDELDNKFQAHYQFKEELDTHVLEEYGQA